MDAIPYIDVTPPYFALKDISTLPPLPGKINAGINCTFSREQPPGLQITSFDAAEIGRHLAILGSLVAARANPIKQKHYYLALHARLQMNEITTSQTRLTGKGFIAEPIQWEKRQVTAYMEAITPTGEQYARLEVRYAILTQQTLLRITRPPDIHRISGNAWDTSQPSPYIQSIMLSQVRISEDTASATLALCDVSRMAGHFDPRPMAPIAILASNALALLGLFLGKRFLCEDVMVVCKRLAVAGEVLEIKMRRVNAGEECEVVDATHVIELVDEQKKRVGTISGRIKSYSLEKAQL